MREAGLLNICAMMTQLTKFGMLTAIGMVATTALENGVTIALLARSLGSNSLLCVCDNRFLSLILRHYLRDVIA